MTVKELIEQLQQLNQDKQIKIHSNMLYFDDIQISEYPKEFLEKYQQEFYYLG